MTTEERLEKNEKKIEKLGKRLQITQEIAVMVGTGTLLGVASVLIGIPFLVAVGGGAAVGAGIGVAMEIRRKRRDSH
jgi:hypothetical protein